MRAPFCSESPDFCPDQKDLLESEKENEIHAIERSLERSCVNKTAVFGICIEDLMETSSQVVPQIPFILSRICNFIEIHGLHQKSIFLDGEETSLVESLKEQFAESGDASLESAGHVASIAKLLIVFLEELPEPLIPISAQSDFIRDIEKLPLNTSDCLSSLKISLEKLPDTSYQVVKYLSRFLMQVAFHEEYNGMSTSSLAVIFGPLIFRPSTNDKQMIISFQDITNCFVKDYHTIFEKDPEIVSGKMQPAVKSSKLSRKKPCLSSVMPFVSLSPLSVVIPEMTSVSCIVENKRKGIPALLIDREFKDFSESSKKLLHEDDKNSLNGLGLVVTRKRKERRFSGEDSQPRSSSEERPSPNSLTSTDAADMMRRCISHEEVVEDSEPDKYSLSKTKVESHFPFCNASDQGLFSNLSPHPPTAKRREIDVYPEMDTFSWESTESNNGCERDATKLTYTKEQNSIVELPKRNTMDCDSSDDEDISESEHQNEPHKISSIPRSASFPLPKSESTSSESEHKSLSLSWSMLFENSEPVRAEPHLNLSKDDDSDESLLSPSVQTLRNSNYYEAPLSPSAFRSYLSYRDTHLDPSVPPSPPVEQEDFVKKLPDSSSTSESIRQLAKKIHSIKKRIRKYEEKFEAEFGFKPSHAEKSNNHEAKKLMNDLYKARKELKALKEEAHLEHVGSPAWHGTQFPHILEDTTNQFPNDFNKEKPKSVVKDLYGFTMKTLADERKSANRPESFEDMTGEQVVDEKLAIQKALLNLEEKINGKPITKEQKETCRPLYDRYRYVKRLLVRSGSFPASLLKTKDLCSDLQPILEHETMHFSTSTQKTAPVKHARVDRSLSPIPKIESISEKLSAKEQKSSSILAEKYDNSNLHELPLSEMIFQMHKIKSEKRRLRKIIKDFEADFLKLNGRKTQKEDKAAMESVYSEYKHVKARLKLLEALISKHDQHQLM